MLKTLIHVIPSLRRSRMADVYFVRCLLRDSVDVPGLKTDYIPKLDAINALVNSFTDDHCGVENQHSLGRFSRIFVSREKLPGVVFSKGVP